METIVLMLVHNEEDHIERAIQSVINQTDQDIELFLVDDASTDRTFDRATSILLDSDLDFKIQLNPKNLGVVKSAAQAFETISRRNCYLIRLDGDDELTPNAIEDLKNAHRLGFFVTGHYNETVEDITTTVKPKTIYDSLACGVLMYIPDIVKAGGLAREDVGLFIEYDLYARLINSSVFPWLIQNPVYTYHRQPNSLTRDTKAIEKSLALLQAYWGKEVVSQIRSYQ